jgi:diguanylate cyclase (GGDEF)-like protein
MSTSRLDEARDQLLQTVDVAARQVLTSKLQIIQLDRSDAVVAATGQIQREHGARGILNSSVTMRHFWDVALAQAQSTAAAIIDACFAVGVGDDDRIGAFAKEDLRNFLTSFMNSRFGHGRADGGRLYSLQQYEAEANSHASRIPHEVNSRRFDYEKSHAHSLSLAPQREKQQKFGILDAPNLLKTDLAETPGILGRVLVYLDIDNFKAVNTRFSERVVDRTILPELQRLVHRAAVSVGHAYGEGGDEIIVYLPNATVDMGVAFASALRRLIEAHEFTVDAEQCRITASVGVAASNELPGETLADLANQAKLQAKASGKNCVVLHRTEGHAVVSCRVVVAD